MTNMKPERLIRDFERSVVSCDHVETCWGSGESRNEVAELNRTVSLNDA